MRVVMTTMMVMALAVSACGKKGALQPPPAQDAPVEKQRALF